MSMIQGIVGLMAGFLLGMLALYGAILWVFGQVSKELTANLPGADNLYGLTPDEWVELGDELDDPYMAYLGDMMGPADGPAEYTMGEALGLYGPKEEPCEKPPEGRVYLGRDYNPADVKYWPRSYPRRFYHFDAERGEWWRDADAEPYDIATQVGFSDYLENFLKREVPHG